ncbi:MAG: TonB-dependent receptor [Bacteroidales bacterium]|nr:TonB-dependent receptor [Bacteroidales bacterium]
MKLKFTFLILALTVMCGLGTAFGQTGTIRGFVYEKASSEPVIFTNVYLKGTSVGAATDVNGYFVISRVPVGNYTLMITSLGYDSLQMPVTVFKDKVINKKLYVNPATYALEGVMISAEREESRSETRTSIIKVTPKQISKIPTVGGQPDLAQYLQVLPGVVFTGDQGGQLYIRGGSPIQNKVLLDGMIIYNPFHSIGLFSVFETDIIRNAEIYTGGFGAEHGGRVSSVMDITTREGNKKRFAGKVAASTFGSSLLLEGPLVKQKENGVGASFLFTAKNSYLEQTSKSVYNYINGDDGLPFNFTDFYGKTSIFTDNGSKINFFGFKFGDKVSEYQSLKDFGWDSYGGGMNFIVIPGNSPALIESNIAYSGYKVSTLTTDGRPKSSSVGGFQMDFRFTYFFGKDSFKYGVEVNGFKTKYDFTSVVGSKTMHEDNTTEIGAYGQYKMSRGNFLMEPSFRLQWHTSLGKVSPEPRLSMKYLISDRIRLKFATGIYSQNMISARSDRDIVNLFYGFISSPEATPQYFGDEKVTHKLQKAEHVILGLEYDLTTKITLNMEGYYKNFSQLANINRYKMYNKVDYPDMPDYLTSDYLIEKGKASGMDFSAKVDYGRLYIWTVYSLGFVNRTEDVSESHTNPVFNTYAPHFDRRHNVNFLMTYVAGDLKDWEFSLRWNMGSGFPFTPTDGFYGSTPFNGGINSDFISENEILNIYYGDYNSRRLPVYHRMDANVKKKFEFSDYSNLEIDLSVTNLYNQTNIFFVDRVSGEQVNQLPIMPSLGMTFRF